MMDAHRPGILKTFWGDAQKLIRVIAPLASISYTLFKAFELPLAIKDWSYAWAFLPLLVWVAVAYITRWKEADALAARLNPKIQLDFELEKCVRDVRFPDGNLSRYVSVLVRGKSEASIPNASIYLHSIEYVHDQLGTTRVDIEGSPPLEWAQSGGRVIAHEPRTLHAGREALINVLYCTNTTPIAELHICSPQQLLREEEAMGMDGTYRVVIRASGDGIGKYAELMLKVYWDGNDAETLQAVVWNEAQPLVHVKEQEAT